MSGEHELTNSPSPTRQLTPTPLERPQVSRRALYLFLTVVVLVVAQAGWWVIYQIYESRRTFDTAVRYAHLERDLAAREVERQAAAGRPETEISAYLKNRFPHLELAPPFEPPALMSQDRAVLLASRVRIREQHMEALRQEVRRRALMFLSEGSFFLTLILCGVYLIHSTLQREVALKKQQSNFISAVTHELKSPLASLRLYLQTIQLKRIDDERAARYVGHMLEDVDRLEVLVENVLEAGRLETRGLRLNLEEIELGEELEQYLAGVRRRLEAQQVELVLELPDEPMALSADREAIRTILGNLLDNAVKYTSPPRRIEIRAFRRHAWAVLEVKDNGIGLPRRETHRIFEKFYRVGNEMVRQVKGTGLGLFLVDGLARAHGGRVEAESPGPDLGSTFRVWLPIGQEKHQAKSWFR